LIHFSATSQFLRLLSGSIAYLKVETGLKLIWPLGLKKKKKLKFLFLSFFYRFKTKTLTNDQNVKMVTFCVRIFFKYSSCG